jgi:hypothetical protein
VEEINAKMEAL